MDDSTRGEVFGAFFFRVTSEAISIGGDFGLGETASCSARLPLPNPPITDLDQAASAHPTNPRLVSQRSQQLPAHAPAQSAGYESPLTIGEATETIVGVDLAIGVTVNLRQSTIRMIRVVVFLIFIVLVSVSIFEALLKIFSYEPHNKMNGYTLLYDEDFLFRIKPLCATDINDLGYRGTHFDHKRTETKKRVLFLGDSFVMGHNVSPGETIAAGLGKSLGSGYEVFNMGVMAYGPDQSLVVLMEHGLDLEPDMVILGIFPANDFQDVQRNRLYSLDGGGRLVRNAENVVTENLSKSWTFFLFDRLQYVLQGTIDKHHRFLSRRYEFLMNDLFADFYDAELLVNPDSDKSRKKIDLMKAILERFDDELKQRGVEFAVVIIPSYLNIVDVSEFEEIGIEEEQYEDLIATPNGIFGPEDIVADLCSSLNIPVVNLYPEFLAMEEEERATMFDEADWHLSAYGNQFSGDLVASVLVKPKVPKPIWKTKWERGSSVLRRPWF